MSALRGFVAGALGLTLLEAAVSTQKAASNASGVVSVLTKGIARIVDPTVPLIPDRRSTVQGQGGTPIILAN